MSRYRAKYRDAFEDLANIGRAYEDHSNKDMMVYINYFDRDVKEVADFLGVDKKTIYSFIESAIAEMEDNRETFDVVVSRSFDRLCEYASEQ